MLLAMPHMLELAACARGKPSADFIFKLHGRFVRVPAALASCGYKHAKNALRLLRQLEDLTELHALVGLHRLLHVSEPLVCHFV
jgi:hypothetical protein